MNCNNLNIIQYKNHKKLATSFHENTVAISGNNGVGKTNILDAIYYSAYTKSYHSRFDYQIPTIGMQGFSLTIQWCKQNEEEQTIKAILRETGKKELYANDVLYTSLHKHIGLLSAVLITPDDIALISEDSSYRRKLIDSILCQTNSVYLQAYMQYQKVLVQRNALLKTMQENRHAEKHLIETINEQLIHYGNILYDCRTLFLQSYLAQVQEQYKNIALQRTEDINITYQTDIKDITFDLLTERNIHKDIAAGRTTAGPHKDDILIHLGGQLFKNIASQGQKKTMLFAFKMAEFYYLSATIKDYPLLMLDDVFEKLDSERLYNLIKSLPTDPNFQLFVTDTSEEKLVLLFNECGRTHQHIRINP
jgi:DNA replication and repair protein RecF